MMPDVLNSLPRRTRGGWPIRPGPSLPTGLTGRLWGIDAALEEIEKNAGVLYDRDVVETCLKLVREKGFRFE